MKKRPITDNIYVAQLALDKAQRKKSAVYHKLEALKAAGNYDKGELKRLKAALTDEWNALTAEIASRRQEVFEQNRAVITAILGCFAGLDLVTRIFDDAGDTFERLTIGGMKESLATLVAGCRDIAAQANDLVQDIDRGGYEAMSMAYADLADEVVDGFVEMFGGCIERYSHTPAGRRYFYGDNYENR